LTREEDHVKDEEDHPIWEEASTKEEDFRVEDKNLNGEEDIERMM